MLARPALACLVSCAFAASAGAQQPIHDFTATWDFGHSVSLALDLDQDGLADVAIGLPRTDPCGFADGEVRVHAGAEGALLETWSESLWFAYGHDLDAAGDVDADGVIDLVEAATDNHPDCPLVNLVSIRSGATGALLQTKSDFAHGSGADDLAVSGIGDADGDGFGDVAVGNRTEKRVTLISGRTGAALATFTSQTDLGSDVSDAGDLDLDGLVDFAMGDRTANGTGVVILRSANGTEIATVPGTTTDEWFGDAIDGLGDLDLDGHPDLIVGAPHAMGFGFATGAAYVVSGKSFGIAGTFPGGAAGDRFGRAVSRQLDFDGDGRDDLAVGSEAGYVRVISGATGFPLATIQAGATPGAFGFAIDGNGDVDGDGRGDLAIGSPGLEGNPAAVRVVGFCDGSATAYGLGCAGAGGFTPTLALDVCPIPGNGAQLTIDDALGHTNAILLFGLGQASAPLPGGCTLLLANPLPFGLKLPLGSAGPGNGSIALAATIPSALGGAHFTMQAFVVDPTKASGFSATNAVEVDVP